MHKFAGEQVGTILGKGQEHDHLEMVVAFVERDKAPKLGSFIVLEEREFMKRKLLCRVERMDYGDLQTSRNERERALVEKYLRGKEGYKRELTEEEKKSLFFRRYTLKVLGELQLSEKKIMTEYRLLPELSSICRYPTTDELKLIISTGLQKPDQAVKVGKLAIGNEVDEAVDVAFESWKFERRRTAVLARTGYGKSNLCKIIVSLAALTSKAGILVLDIDGEYAFETISPDGSKVPGLADFDLLKPKLVVYSERTDILDRYKEIEIKPFINLELLPTWQISKILSGQSDSPKVLEDIASWDEAKQEEWKKLIRKVRTSGNDRTKRIEYIDEFMKEINIPENQQKPLRRALLPLLELDNPKANNFIKEIPSYLRQRKLVVLDLSLMSIDQGIQLSAAVLNEVFRRNVRGITSGKVINAIAVFEEAQNVLNKKQVEEGSSVFVRWAKEGRKFHLGLIYVTQQPGAIAEEIVSQTDNYFVMHLLNQGDIEALQRANRHYGGVIAQFLGNETIVGNTYIYSAPYQPYIFPAHVFEFSKQFFDNQFGKFDLQEIANALKQVAAGASGKDLKEVIGAASREIYKYLKLKELLLPIMDDDKQWVEYSFAEAVLRTLHRGQLLTIPQFDEADMSSLQAGSGDEEEDYQV